MKIDKSFEEASYQGTFRDFQRQLLKKLEDRLDERKLNIVTPPGSGKVVLGLEIVRRKGAPCLVISPNAITRAHWGEQFAACFLPAAERENRDSYLSYDLKKPALLTSVTYDTLHCAMKKMSVKEGDQTVNFADTDIIRLMQECGIRTVLLDEPHHLDNSLLDSLESFLGVLGGEFHVLSLTSNLPYDLHSDEWDRYESLCGNVSEEIHIPDLVKGLALCPHQDYVYFNHPTAGESKGIRGYRTRVDDAVAEAVTLPFMGELGRRISKMYNRQRMDFLYNHHEAVVGILEMLHEYGYKIDMVVYNHLTGRKNVSPLTAEMAQRAINLLLESQTLLRDGEKEQLIEVCTRFRVLDRGFVQLSLTPKVRRTLMTSVGKLESMVTITKTENAAMGDSLRMIVLTDPVKAGELDHIGQRIEPTHLSMASAFEVLTNRLPRIPIGCVTGNCAILPGTVMRVLKKTYGLPESAVRYELIESIGYVRCFFADDLTKIDLTTRLFRDGYIRVLLGSADVLGDGWDDSFVNTMIVACFDGSFVEINRIRGRVLHADKAAPKKVAHIWHLVTIEHPYAIADYPRLRLASRLTAEADGGLAADFRHLCRRFECYMGPNVDTGELENGINRLGLGAAPQMDRMAQVNQATLDRADRRAELSNIWHTAMGDTTKPISEVRVPKEAKVPVFTMGNTILLLASLFGLIGGLYAVWFLTTALILYVFFNNGLIVTAAVLVVIILLVVTVVLVILSILFILYFLPLPVSHLTASVSVRSLCRNLLKALKDIGEINKDAIMVMETLPDKKGYRLYIDNCNHEEQVTFQKSVAEMFSPIRNPRYILVRGGWFHRLLWRWSFTCPTVIARNDVSVKVFEKYIRRSMGSMKFQYTRRDPGRKFLIFARNKSYQNARNKPCEKRIHLLKNERVL